MLARAQVAGQGLIKVWKNAQGHGQVGRSPKISYPRGVDIRTKLVFALVAVTLGSLAAFGMVMDDIADTMISEAAQDQLEGLAASGEDALESIVDGWRERVQLIASRTQLRVSLRDYNASGDSGDAMRIGRILGDAATSVKSVAALAVFDTDQQLVVQIGLRADSTLDALESEAFPDTPDGVRYLGAYVTEHGVPRVAYSTQLTLDSEHVGYLFVLLNGNRLVDLTSDTSGLGETGELMVVSSDQAGVRTLHAVRHPIDGTAGGESGAILLDGEDDPALLALANEEGVFTEGLRDYRGEQVWAATRFVEETEWGLVVKFDANEKKATIDDFRGRLYTLALSLAGIGLLVAVFLGFRLSKPIHDLAAVANRIREGDLNARAHRTREDEIGLLAHTFNDMAAELQVRMAELHEYHKFFDVSLDLMCIAGTDGYFKRTNPAFTKVLGWTEEQLVSKPFLDLVHPDDVEATQNEIDKLARGVPTISFLNRFRRSDGSWIYLRWNSYPDPETGLLYAIARQIEDPQEA
jgi:PAS domain S-box-containing protein